LVINILIKKQKITMTSLDAILKQYEDGQSKSSSPKANLSREDRLKKYFATYLPKGEIDGEKTIRILPTSDGSQMVHQQVKEVHSMKLRRL
jgi:hypothetical protein